MTIAILTAGSRGDTQPYLALGLALQKAGQQVRIAAFENFADFIKSYGLDYFPIHGDVSLVATREGSQQARQADNPLKFLLSLNRLKSYLFDLQGDFCAACEGAEAVVYHPGALIGYFIAQQKHIPSIFAPPFPMAPTRDYPSLIFYDAPRLGRGFNYLTHKLFELTMWMASRGPIEQYWRQTFGNLPANFGAPFGRQTTPEKPTVVACSNYVLKRPADWPSGVYNTGYWFLDEAQDWEPPADLDAFLAQGPPPVYVGFGSAGNLTQAAQTTKLVVEALQQAGQRGVLATGWQGMALMSDLPKEIFILKEAPHSWLFPRMQAVAHHGGAGTTAAGLRAGMPSIVVPFSNDQFAWGRRVHELGVGPRPIPRKKLNAAALAQAIQDTLVDEVRQAARELGCKIRSEDGSTTAAQIIMSSIR